MSTALPELPEPRLFDRASPPHIVTLVLATATASLAMNVFLPSLPGMAGWFKTDYATVQAAVSVYLAANAVLQIFIGPLSDRFGRRPVMLAGFAVFIAATIAALFAPSAEWLLVCRAFQSFAVAGTVLSRAIIRDMVDAAEAASRIGYVTMGMTLAPMIGPVIGGALDARFGWQASFVVLLLTGIAAFAAIFFDLGETNRNRGGTMRQQFVRCPDLLGESRFWGYALAAGLTSGAYFAFLGGGPLVATSMLGVTAAQYGIYSLIIAVGYMTGNFLSGRFARTMGVARMMHLGNVVAIIGLSVSLALFAAGSRHPLTLFGPIFFLGIGNGLTLPSANAGMVSVRPELAGSASGLGGALQIAVAAILSVAAGLVISPETGPWPLLALMLASASGGLACSLATASAEARQNRTAP